MDFNILTFHTADNYGAVLQAFALQEFISNQGYSAGVFDYTPTSSGKRSIKGKVYDLVGKHHKKAHTRRKRRFADFREKYLRLNNEENSRIYIAGSDQVWNPNSSMDPMFFLRFVGDNSLRASYAASIGVSAIPEDKKTIFKDYISRFDAVSVREADAKLAIDQLYDGDVSVNVDPSLLCQPNGWEKVMSKVEGVPEEYILVYLLHIPKNINKLLKWLKTELKCPIVLIDGSGVASVVSKNDIALHDVGPKEFLWLFANAKSVVTSSFHGTAFSIIFHKEFYSVINPAFPSRISNLLSMCQIASVGEDDTSFSRNVIDWACVDEILGQEREKSAAYINELYRRSKEDFRKPVSGSVNDIKNKCTGCAACEAVCPTSAISMVLNKEGFLEPMIDSAKCINCSVCKKSCPLNAKVGETRKRAWYGWHNDKEVRYTSSSGGAFRALADEVLKDGGVVYGAVYSNNWRSVEIASTDDRSIVDIQKSKYTVSDPTGVYKKIKEQLEAGRRVLFCSTPCQNAGLTAYLKKDYENLLRCDFVCGGMSSLSFYREHLEHLEKQYNSKLKNIDFRPKTIKWSKVALHLVFENGKNKMFKTYKDTYFSCFSNYHVSVRTACLDCEYRARHVSDITLADFWGFKAAGVKPYKEGLSLVVANTEKGISAVENAENLVTHPLDIKYTDYAFSSKGANPAALKRRDSFFEEAERVGFEKAAQPYLISTFKHLKSYIKVKLHLK